MASRKTWVWILVGILSLGLVALVVIAAASVYFVTRHISTERSTTAEALRAFDTVHAAFPNQKPLYVLDSADQPAVVRPLKEIPSSATRPEHLRVLAWDPDEERLVKISLPFWILRIHGAKMDIAKEFDLEHLDLDGAELERIGPALLVDFRDREGARVLLWTQ
jgi:hypothetical protein